MKRINTTKTLLAGAALAGIMTGGFVARTHAASTNAQIVSVTSTVSSR
jgi:hypothetical protein